MTSTEAELENFRQRWREEVTAKAKGRQPAAAVPARTTHAQASSSRLPKNIPPEAPPAHPRPHSEEIDEVTPHVYKDLGEKQHGRRLDDKDAVASSSSAEPISALEHYEKAVERESQGSLGDSLALYRRAFKLDERVHEKYKAKHFPPSYFKSAGPKPTDTKHSGAQPAPSTSSSAPPSTSTTQSLIESFANLSILGEEPPTDLSPPPPCPIATIPEEILVEILEAVAVRDVAAFAHLAQVCKRFAYLISTEDRIWRRIALGHEYGFAAMHYTWGCQINGKPLDEEYVLGENKEDDDLAALSPSLSTPASLTALLVPSVYPSYRTLFRRRPRVRFNGCYISTVNYTRPGASSPTSVTWNSPIHIVTYYRYLRFLRDGSCISLLTTSEPQDVVPYLYLTHMHKNHGSLPSAPMKDALLGRWRLTGPEVPGAGEDGEKEGTLMVETAGVTPKYLYKMVLGVGSAGRGARNNKLVWQGYWSYNRLTDDWAEFGLKNDRPFYWSRVKSYGMSLDERVTAA